MRELAIAFVLILAVIHAAMTFIGFYVGFTGGTKEDWTYFVTVVGITAAVCGFSSYELLKHPKKNSRPYSYVLFGIVVLHTAYGVLIGGKLITGWHNSWLYAYTMIIFMCAITLRAFTSPDE